MTDSNKREEPQRASEAVKKLFDDARKKLVETGTRNRLIHVNRANARGNVINIVNELSDNIYEILYARKTMRFMPLGKDSDDDSGESIRLAGAGDHNFEEERYSDNFLETRLGPDALQKRLLKIAKDAQTAEEEQGVNILYLALGFLTWYEDNSSSVKREAPLLLLPVELVRNHRTSTYDIKLREEDILTNLPLKKRLFDDFGMDIPLVEVDEGWTPASYFQKISPIISSRNRWEIDQNGIQLGFFSFSKLLMFLDLAVDAWPNNALVNHLLTRGLLYEGFESEGSPLSEKDKLDEVLPPSKMFHVVDADASQARVIEEARSGLNLVVQGPPGTGKSQTITNIIAAAVKDGKKVLFIAEKMAALSVVHSRLVNVGLRDTCLELHSRSANKKAVLAELARTLNATQAIPIMPGLPTELTETRDLLNNLSDAIHAPLAQTGESAFSVLARQSRFIGMKAAPPRINAEQLVMLSRTDEKRIVTVIEQYGDLLSKYERIQDHPFSGTLKLNLQPVEMSRVTLSLAKVFQLVSASAEALQSILDFLAMERPCTITSAKELSKLLNVLALLRSDCCKEALLILACPDLDRLEETLKFGLDWKERRQNASIKFKEEAFTQSLSALRPALVAGTTSFFSRWGSSYRHASKQLASWLIKPLPKRADERVSLVDQICHVATCRSKFEEDQQYCTQYLENYWRGDRTDFSLILDIIEWCKKLSSLNLKFNPAQAIALAVDQSRLKSELETVRKLLTDTKTSIEGIVASLGLNLVEFGAEALNDLNLLELASRFKRMELQVDRYNEWVQIQRNKLALNESGLPDLDALMESGQLSASAAVIEFRFARAEQLWKLALEMFPVLQGLDGVNRHKIVEKFAALERSRLKDNVTSILAGHLSQVPQGAMGEMRIVRGEIGKKKSHIAIRKLFSSAPAAIQRIKPVLLMSPISVAQFLPPGSITFDLLIIDEASQVKPEDSLGAIARANQIVVVGDQKQLPPSSFFDRLLDDEILDESGTESDSEENLLGSAAKAGEMESILTLCEARGLNSRMLKWHYRSRDPSLIRVSNREFYKDELILPPSPLQSDPEYGLCFTKVNGVYDRGGKRDNRIEGEAIVSRIAQHARTRPELSLGIVTFSAAQKNLITELLEFSRRADSVLDAFLREGKSEDVFVKNIENVQGDERDVIIVSVGYGPSIPGGRLNSMSFGPVNAEGGERRLNVLFTRARVRCEVFTSFDPGDIDPARVKGEGPRVFKRFLEFAKSGVIDESAPTGEDFDSPFEEDVADVIKNMGFHADPQVGSVGFKIDLGIRHPERPGTYILAVECDGATYHSALWCRERDRLRQDVLEHLGWRFHRIWSTDWFYNRVAEIERLKGALEIARLKASSGIQVKGANSATLSNQEPLTAIGEIEMVQPVEAKMPPYVKASFTVPSRLEPHEISVSVLANVLLRIVEVEGPIHTDEAARRLASCFGKEKAGSRILSATENALKHAKSMNEVLVIESDFWLTTSQYARPVIRNREEESGTISKANYISMIEIRAALALAREQNAGGTDEELVRSAARLLGFKRVGLELQERIASGLGD